MKNGKGCGGDVEKKEGKWKIERVWGCFVGLGIKFPHI